MLAYIKKIGLALFSLTLTGCALKPLPTPSGNPEVTINASTQRVKSTLVSRLSSQGYILDQDTPYSLSFHRQMDGGSAMLYQVALGNAYSSTPQMIISFTFAPQNGGTRVFAHVNTSMANAFGRVEQVNMDRGKAGHEVQAMLGRVKSEMEGGTRGR